MSPLINSRIGPQVITFQPDLINIYDSSIGEGCRIATFVEIGGADVGEQCEIGAYVKISNKCKIGNRTKIGHNSVIMAGAVIGDDVTIGACSIVVPDVVIGAGATIGINACVSRDVASGENYPGSVSRMTESAPFISKAVLNAIKSSNDNRDERKKKADIPCEPAISSDHPCRKIADESKIEYRGGKPYQTHTIYVDKDNVKEFNIQEVLQFGFPPGIDEFLSRTQAHKGECLTPPESREEDLIGLNLGGNI